MSRPLKTFDEFCSDYHKKGFLDLVTTIRRPTKELNSKQLSTAYASYIKKTEHQEKKDSGKRERESPDSDLSTLVRRRDSGECRLLSVLEPYEYMVWSRNHNGLGWTIDAAHVFGKGAFPSMRYLPDNVVCLNRYSHNLLDQHCSPIDGKALSSDSLEGWWRRIVGETVYARLLEYSTL